MRNFRVPLSLVVFLASLVLVSGAGAAVTGTASFVNCSGGGVAVSGAAIVWTPIGSQAGTGCMTTSTGTSLVYSGGSVGPSATADIKNLTVGGPALVDNFINILGTAPLIDFQLSGLLLPSAPTNGTNCAGLGVGQSCVVASGSPFLLTATVTGTNIGLAMTGLVKDGVGLTNGWSGLFTTQSTLTAGTIQTTILGGGSVNSSYSGVVIIPEPGTVSMLLLGAGLLGLGWKRRSAR